MKAACTNKVMWYTSNRIPCMSRGPSAKRLFWCFGRRGSRLWREGRVVCGRSDSNRGKEANMKTLGFIGTGGMGSGMAANLIKAG
ncbi:MAG: hypothetical protein ACREQW_10015, partial [Candidatus Binatia bacterium]